MHIVRDSSQTACGQPADVPAFADLCQLGIQQLAASVHHIALTSTSYPPLDNDGRSCCRRQPATAAALGEHFSAAAEKGRPNDGSEGRGGAFDLSTGWSEK